MVEALRDYSSGECEAPSGCFLPLDQFGQYKHISGLNTGHPQIKKYTFAEWEEICDVFGMSISCLFGGAQTLSFSDYRRFVTPESVFERERSDALDEKNIYPERISGISAGLLSRKLLEKDGKKEQESTKQL